MAFTQDSKAAERPSAWAIGLFAFSILCLVGAFALLALVP
jgi:hypothetical protein